MLPHETSTIQAACQLRIMRNHNFPSMSKAISTHLLPGLSWVCQIESMLLSLLTCQLGEVLFLDTAFSENGAFAINDVYWVCQEWRTWQSHLRNANALSFRQGLCHYATYFHSVTLRLPICKYIAKHRNNDLCDDNDP